MYLKEFRLKKGLSQSQLANASGVPIRLIRAYEQGARSINKAEAETVFRLAMALDVEVQDLLSNVDEILEELSKNIPD